MKDLTWGLLMALTNNTCNIDSKVRSACTGERFSLTLQTEKAAWHEITEFAAQKGCNAVVINLGDAVKLNTHPEIAIDGAWSIDELKEELDRLRELGLTPYPKMNFSAGHDAWLGEYSRMVSTPTYYRVVKDIIQEVIDIFDTPELFHLGLDEENGLNQQKLNFACYRQFDLIWHDLNFYFDCVKEKGVRPWMWADYFWTHEEDFAANVPKDVLISPWYYSHMYADVSAPLADDDWNRARRESFRKLSDLGYDLLPCGSNCANRFNYDHIVRFARENIAPEHNKGLLNAPWAWVTERSKYGSLEGIHLAKYVKDRYFGESK